MSKKKNTAEEIPIRVSSRILRHISRGIYRSPAGALKELISNSYDAGAKKVTINTGYPNIESIIITDNGEGMSESKFKDIIQHIGYSEKDLGQEVEVLDSKAKRKTIGHYGIGFLAISQLAKKATILSKKKGDLDGIEVTIDFDQFEEHKINGLKRSRIKDEKEIEKKDEDEASAFSVGNCRLLNVEFSKETKNEHFTKITLTDIREDVQRDLIAKNSSNLDSSVESIKPYSARFEDIIDLLRKKDLYTKYSRLRQYPYEMLLWELSVYAPLQFPNLPIFKDKGAQLKSFDKLTNSFDFEVVVDGFILSKPYDREFFQNKQPLQIFSWENQTYHNKYKVSAFLFYQPSTMIRPKSMQGVVVRENGVAVGTYDLTFLRYPFNEGPKFNSLTGEIFAEGLSGAMNVDRDSFNQTAEEYVALTEWFHDKLYNEVFSAIQRFQKTSESPTKERNERIFVDVIKTILNNSKKLKTVEIKHLGKKNKNRIVISGQKLIVNSDHRDCEMSSAKKEKLLLAASLVVRGYVTPDQIDEVSDLIELTKKTISPK